MGLNRESLKTPKHPSRQYDTEGFKRGSQFGPPLNFQTTFFLIFFLPSGKIQEKYTPKKKIYKEIQRETGCVENDTFKLVIAIHVN